MRSARDQVDGKIVFTEKLFNVPLIPEQKGLSHWGVVDEQGMALGIGILAETLPLINDPSLQHESKIEIVLARNYRPHLIIFKIFPVEIIKAGSKRKAPVSAPFPARSY